MAALVPLLTTTLVTQGVGFAVNEFSRRKSQDQALDQLQERQALQQQQAAQDAALDRERLALDARIDEEERQKALRRAVARQRANFGAQGVGSGAGSSQAVLLGLFKESDDEKARRDELDALRLNAIDQDLGQSTSLNVLHRTQLKERNRLNNLRVGTRVRILLRFYRMPLKRQSVHIKRFNLNRCLKMPKILKRITMPARWQSPIFSC